MDITTRMQIKMTMVVQPPNFAGFGTACSQSDLVQYVHNLNFAWFGTACSQSDDQDVLPQAPCSVV